MESSKACDMGVASNFADYVASIRERSFFQQISSPAASIRGRPLFEEIQ